MNGNVSFHEKKALGGYAIQRVRLSDLVKAMNKKDEDRARKEESEKLQEVAEESHDILAEARTVFPFTLFPDIVTIDKHKLTVVHRTFFNVEQTVSVPIENIKNVEADHGPVFGSITITSDNFVNNTQKLNYLKRSDARTIQRLLQGAIVAVKEGVNVNEVPTKRLRKLLIDLGEGRGKAEDVS